MKLKYLLLAISVFFVTASAAWAKPSEELKINEKSTLKSEQTLEKKQPLVTTASGLDKQNPLTAQNLVPKSSPTAETQGALTQLNPINIEPETDNEPDNGMAQMTNVSQLQDVKPTDWAYQALQSLVERYGCIQGYPDATFKGNKSLSRYEFAAGLNTCLKQVEKLIASTTTDFSNKDDLATVKKLTEEFNTELTALQGRVDKLEARTGQLENHQFSTTAFFGGEAIIALSGAGGGNPPGTGTANTVLNHLTRVGIVSSFTGKDRLRVMLATGNFDNLGFANPNSLNTRQALLSYQAGLNNQIQLDSLEYRIAALGDRVVFTFKPVGFSLSDILTANSPYYDAGRGAISRFAEASPLFKIGAPDAGAGFDWLINNKLRFQVAYGVRNASNPALGLSKSDHSTLGVQLLIKPTSNILAGIAYMNGYSADGRLDTFTGSFNADTSGQLLSVTPMTIQALNGSFQWRLSPKVTFGAWGGLVYSQGINSPSYAVSSTYLFSMGFPDPFGRKGDLFAVLVGQPPNLYITNGPVAQDPGTSMHYEAFYRFRVNDRISVTPGFFVVTEPGNVASNQTIYVGSIRTTFRF